MDLPRQSQDANLEVTCCLQPLQGTALDPDHAQDPPHSPSRLPEEAPFPNATLFVSHATSARVRLGCLFYCCRNYAQWHSS